MTPKTDPPPDSLDQPPPLERAWRRLIGSPRDVRDPRIFHRISLMAFLAWIGLGADGLSSSAYGPAEAFKNLLARNPVTGRLEGQWYLAIFLALAAVEKFEQGAWKTLLITCVLIAGCVWVRRHYRSVEAQLHRLDLDRFEPPLAARPGGEPDPRHATAVLLVRDYGGMGLHMVLSLGRMFPGYFRNVIFASAAVIDSGHFKGKEELQALRQQVEESLSKYVALARRLGYDASSASTVTTDPVEGLFRVCMDVAALYPRAMFFGGKLIWKRESWWQRILHNETAYQVQRRLQWKGLTMTVIPLRTGAEVPAAPA